MKVPVFCAGALQVRWAYFAVVVLTARAIRYAALAYLGRAYGHEAFAYLKAHGWQAALLALADRGDSRHSAADVSTPRSGIGKGGMKAGSSCWLCVCAAAQEPAEILGRIRHNVEAQVSRSANYSCVATIERNLLYHFLGRTGVQPSAGERTRNHICGIVCGSMSPYRGKPRFFRGTAKTISLPSP